MPNFDLWVNVFFQFDFVNKAPRLLEQTFWRREEKREETSIPGGGRREWSVCSFHPKPYVPNCLEVLSVDQRLEEQVICHMEFMYHRLLSFNGGRFIVAKVVKFTWKCKGYYVTCEDIATIICRLSPTPNITTCLESFVSHVLASPLCH